MRRGRRVLVMAGIALVAVIAALNLLRGPLEGLLRRTIESRAARLLGAPVRVSGLTISYVPAVLRLEGASLEPGETGAFGAEVDRIEVRGSPLALLGLRGRPVAIDVSGPRVRLQPRAESPAPDRAPDPPGTALVRLAALPGVWELRVRDGGLEVSSGGGFAARLSGVSLEARPRGRRAAVEGRARFSDASLSGPAGDWEGLRGECGFVIAPDGVHLDPINLDGAGISAAGRGVILPGPPPAFEGAVDLEARVESLGRFLAPAVAPTGRLEARLEGRYGAASRAATGKVRLEALGLWGVEIESLEAALNIAEGIRLSDIRARLMGGEGAGTIDVTLPPHGRPGVAGRVRLSGIDLERVLAFAGWSGPRLRGALSYEGEHSIDSGGLPTHRGAGRLEASGRYIAPSGADLPLLIRTRLTGEGAGVTLTDGTIEAGSVSGRFSGSVRPGEGLRLRLSGATGNLSEILPLFAPPAAPPAAPRRKRSAGVLPGGATALFASMALGPRNPGRADAARPPAVRAAPRAPSALERMIEALGGRWTWDGDLSVDAGGLGFEGRLSGSDLTWGGRPLGALGAVVVYRDETLSIREATLSHAGGGEVRLAGRMELGGAGGLAIEADAMGFPAGSLLAMAGVAMPVEGTIRGHVRVGGRPSAPEGRAVIESGLLKVAGFEFERLEGAVDFDPARLAIRNVVLTQGSGTVTIDGWLPMPGTGNAPSTAAGDATRSLAISARAVDLSAWLTALTGIPLAGTLAGEGAVGGALDAPAGTFSARVENVTAWGKAIGEVAIDATLDGTMLSLRGSAPARDIAFEGLVDTGPSRRIDLRATFTDTEIKGAELLADAPEGGGLALSGGLAIGGRYDSLDGLTAQVILETLRVMLPSVEIANDGAIEAFLEQGRLRLAPVLLIGAGTRVDVRGAIDAGPGGDVEGTARGIFDLALLRAVIPALQATGQGEVEVTVGGTRDAPVFEGALRVSASRVRYADLPFPINDLEGRLVFDGSRLRVETLRGIAGGGEVTGDGFIAFGDAGGAAGPLVIRSAAIGLKGKGVNAEFPEGFRSLSDVDLRLEYEGEATTLGGTVDLVRGVYYRDFEVESSIVRGRAPGLFDLEALKGPLTGLHLDLAIRAGGDVWLRNDFGSMEGMGDLRVTGTAGAPSVAGRIAVSEGGAIRFNKVRYRIQNGALDFTDPVAINPVFDLSAETTIAEYQVNLKVSGTFDDFSFDLTSVPPLPQQDIVMLLLTGRTLASLGPEGGMFAEETAAAYLTGQLTEELTGRLSGRAGLDVIVIDPLQVNAQGDPTTRVTLGKQITPDLFVTYSDEIGSNLGSIYQLDYSITPHVKFTSLRDRDGSIGGDFRYVIRQPPPSLPGLRPDSSPLRPPVVGAIRIEGEARFAEPRIRRRLRMKPGAPPRRATVNEAIERLRAFYLDHGYLMAEVGIKETPAGHGVIDLVVRIDAGPKVTLEIEGTRGRQGLREKVSPLFAQGLFAEEIVESARRELVTVFEDRGYLKASVDAEILRDDPRSLRARFTVRRGPRARADAVRVAGSEQIPEKEILGVVRTSPDTLFSRGLVRRGRLREDATAVRGLYFSRGFPAAAVVEPEVDLDDAGRRATVTFRVEEGPRVTLRQVRFEGTEFFPPGRLRKRAAIAAGAPYTRDGAEAAAQRLRRAYDEAGFPDASVTHRLDTVAAGPESEEGDLIFRIEEGARQSVGRVEIHGNLHTRQDVIRKSLAFTPGGLLSRGDLLASERRLYRLGILNSVQIEARPVADPEPGAAAAADPAAPPGPRDGRPVPAGALRTIDVTVQEAGPLSQVYGIGYDSEEKARGQYEIANRNILGSGRYLGLQTRASRLEQRATLLYREGGVFGGRYDALASAFWQDEVRPAFDVRTLGSSIQLSRQVTRATRLLYRYSLRDVDLSEASVDFEGTTLRLSSVSASAVHDTRDSPFDPRRGHYIGAEAQLFARALGSEAEFTRVYGQIYYFREVLPRTVWAQALRAGAANPFGRSHDDPASTGDALSGVPASERFFAGGDTALRGFRRDRVGDADAGGDPVGGEGLLLLSEELRFPIFRKLQGVVFYDVGNVYRTLDDYDLGDVRHVAGAGMRIATPIGPFRFEYGAILDRRVDEPRGQFFISIGQAF